MFHAPIHTPPTPIAAQAIIAQIETKGDCTYTCYADVGGVEHEFEAWFRVEWERVGEYRQPDYDEATCTLVGAYAYDENGDVLFVGNRSETIALIGEPAEDRWEAEQGERETEAGK